MSTKEPVTLTTPHGHEIQVVIDHANGEVNAKVVNSMTGVIAPLSEETKRDIADLFRVSALEMQAQALAIETKAMVPGGAAMLAALGPEHPGIAPYVQEISKHEALAQQAGEAAAQLGVRVSSAADRVAEGKVTSVPNKNSVREI